MKFFLFSSISFLLFVFSESVAQGSLVEKIKWPPFVEIRIRHCVESYCREEVNILYIKDETFKIHSIRLTTYSKEKQIDTVFTLSNEQVNKLMDFDKYFSTETFPTEVIMAGSITTMGFIVNDQVRTLRNKSSYSFIETLISQ